MQRNLTFLFHEGSFIKRFMLKAWILLMLSIAKATKPSMNEDFLETLKMIDN